MQSYSCVSFVFISFDVEIGHTATKACREKQIEAGNEMHVMNLSVELSREENCFERDKTFKTLQLVL
jgi:hypothetical protein